MSRQNQFALRPRLKIINRRCPLPRRASSEELYCRLTRCDDTHSKRSPRVPRHAETHLQADYAIGDDTHLRQSSVLHQQADALTRGEENGSRFGEGAGFIGERVAPYWLGILLADLSRWFHSFVEAGEFVIHQRFDCLELPNLDLLINGSVGWTELWGGVLSRF